MQYRAGAFEAAIEAIERSEELSNGAYFGYNSIFLAMAHWQLGNKTQAREFYDKSLDWRKQNKSNDELNLFFAEAEELLRAPDAERADLGNEDD